MTRPPDFRIGDRVRYIIPAGGMGNADLEGCTGTVVCIDHTRAPITVRLDEPYIDSVPELRVENPRATESEWRSYLVIPNCWFCKAENLVRIVDERTGEPVRRDPAAWKKTEKPGRGKAITVVPSRETLKKRKGATS